MDLQALASLEKKNSGSASQRHATARDLIRLGVECLHEAAADDYQDSTLLAEACEHLLEAIRHNRSDPDAYVGMGYLLWIAGEHTEALLYLSEAVLLDPQNTDARTLVEFNQQALRAPRSAERLAGLVAPSRLAVPAEDEFDRRYDALEDRIKEELRQLAARKPDAFAVTNDRFRVERMERHFGAMIQTHAELEAELTIVGQEIDCEGLQRKLKPLEIALKRVCDVLNRCWMLIELQDSLAFHNAWLKRQLGLGAGLPADFSHERFHRLLNDCDHLADLLDGLEHGGEDVTHLIGAYERLVAHVGDLQDRVDAHDGGQPS
ncbi:MAG: hypothetical protein ACAI44_30650 [Candidatus Sericytochromatia bacterium]